MIHILAPEIANRIAAGEVVERPASVVRELIDNAVDAGAGRIDVEVQDGGLGLIRVTDDGSGMSREDAQLCIKRHATSKIERSEDLHAIHTRGFRGEALAAIGSVSKFEIKTRTADESLGTLISVEGGLEQAPRDAGTPVGTAVTVRDLFYNVPARRKFLKKPSTELSHVLFTITWNALAHETVHFTFAKNGRRSLDYPAVSNRPERIEQIFGKDILDDLIPVHYDSPEVIITGFISRPTLTRNTAHQIFFFVNDRYIRDRMLHTAMMNGYRSLIHPGRYPLAFLFYEINPEEIDINVHPTKQEIKFSREQAIFSATYRAIRQAWDVDNTPEPPPFKQPELTATPEEPQPKRYEPKPYIVPADNKPALAPKFEPSASTASTSTQHPQMPRVERPLPHEQPIEPSPASSQSASAKDNNTQLAQSKPEVPAQPKPPPNEPAEAPKAEPNQQEAAAPEAPKQEPSSVETLNRRSLQTADAQKDSDPHAPSPPPSAANALHDLLHSEKKPDALFEVQSLEGVEPLTVCGQLLNSYILAQSSEGLYIIDQHAAHERLKFEEFLQAAQKRVMASQPLLFPITIDLAPDEVALLEGHNDVFTHVGFDLEAFGPKTFVIRAAPAALNLDDAESFVKDLLGEIKNEGSTEEKRERALHTMACRAAVKFGEALNQDEMEAIIRGLEAIPRRNVCPHGRPSILYVSDQSLRKLFKRLGF